jgi:hypothetical protein
MAGIGRELVVLILRVLIRSLLGLTLFHVAVLTAAADYDEWTITHNGPERRTKNVICFIILSGNSTGITEQLQKPLENKFKSTEAAADTSE